MAACGPMGNEGMRAMPSVNGKKFPYDKAGKAAAKAEAKKTGKPMETLPEFHHKRMMKKGK